MNENVKLFETFINRSSPHLFSPLEGIYYRGEGK